MKLSKKEVQHVAHLARLGVPEKELDFYAKELSVVLDYVEQLNDLDLSDVKPTNHATGLYSIFREDEQHPLGEKEREGVVGALRRAFPFVDRSFVKVKAVFDKNKTE